MIKIVLMLSLCAWSGGVIFGQIVFEGPTILLVLGILFFAVQTTAMGYLLVSRHNRLVRLVAAEEDG